MPTAAGAASPWTSRRVAALTRSRLHALLKRRCCQVLQLLDILSNYQQNRHLLSQQGQDCLKMEKNGGKSVRKTEIITPKNKPNMNVSRKKTGYILSSEAKRFPKREILILFNLYGRCGCQCVGFLFVFFFTFFEIFAALHRNPTLTLTCVHEVGPDVRCERIVRSHPD